MIYHNTCFFVFIMDRLVILMCIIVAVQCGPIYQYLELDAPTAEELSFMKKYGYLPVPDDEDAGLFYTPYSISKAVEKLQSFAGLPQTGVLDTETRNLFKKKRCGVKDIEDAPMRRRRRYILQQGWSKRIISYRVLNGSSTLDKSRVEELMATGLAVWAPHGGLQFTKREDGPADIQVSFASGDHGDGFPFDGPGRVVAHAFPPPHGAMHFDDDEIWGSDPDEEFEDITDFFAVAVHEIGHALGLSHSSVKASVMYPYYQVPVERLHMDDILGMQELYLKDPTEERIESLEDTVTHPVPRSTKADSDENDVPDLCYTNYDTIQVLHGEIFVFEEEWVWKLHERKEVAAGYPRRFHEQFRGLPEDVYIIRAVYETRSGNIRVFNDTNYYEFDRTFRLTSQGSIYEYGLPSYVKELTTVFLSNYNNKTYLIDERRFWRYDEDTATMDRGYPKDMAVWRDIPSPVDSALIWKGDTYMFTGPRFWRFDNSLVRAHEYYPLPTAQVWFPCPRTQDMDLYVVNDGP